MQTEKTELRLPSIFFVLAVFVCSLAVTFFAWRTATHSIRELAQNKFQKEVSETILLFEDRLELYFSILYSARALFNVLKTETVDWDEWTAFNKSDTFLHRFPGINKIRFTQRVKSADRLAFIEGVRTEMAKQYPELTDYHFKIFPDGEREESYVVKYLEPFKPNLPQLGFDVLSEPLRRDAFSRARDSGNITATARITLLSDLDMANPSPSFQLILPIYRFGALLDSVEKRREALYGFVDIACRMEDFIKSAFSDKKIAADIEFDVFDNPDLDDASILFSSGKWNPNAVVPGGKPEKPQFTTIREIDIGGTVWMLRFRSGPHFQLGPIQQRFPLFVAMAGGMISILLFGVLYSFTTSHARAVRYAEQMTHDLREEVKARTRAEADLRRALKVKSEFLSMVSHELRTPLTVIKESLGIVQDGSAGTVNTEQRDFLCTALDNLNRLTRLINDVLDFQRIEAGRLNFKMQLIDMNEVVSEVLDEFKIVAERKKIRLAADLAENLPVVHADRDKIIQVLTNLINNAIKFSREGTVKVSTLIESGGVKVSVADQGPGIREADFSKLFQSFSQIDNDDGRQVGGTGLGLAISKKIIEGHSGRIGVNSKIGEGSVFYFILELSLEREAKA